MSKIILVGGFHETVELCEMAGVEIAGIIDPMAAERFMGYPVLGSDADIPPVAHKYTRYPLLITPDKPDVRLTLVEFYRQMGFRFTSLISPKALISKSAVIGEGVIIQSGVNVSAAVVLGDFVRVNSCANIMHDSVVGVFTSVAPNAVLLGNVKVGGGSYIGANSTLLPGVAVGDNVMVGAGSVVTKSYGNNCVLAGNPARVIRNGGISG